MAYIPIPINPTNDKNILASFCAHLIIMDMEASFGYNGLKELKSFNNNELRQVYDILINEFEYDITNHIKKSLKLSYGSNRLFGLSSIEMNNFITDVRKEIHRLI